MSFKRRAKRQDHKRAHNAHAAASGGHAGIPAREDNPVLAELKGRRTEPKSEPAPRIVDSGPIVCTFSLGLTS